jgi:RNase H-like domain found in reverse transcriptase/Integrase zinc binding domain
LVYLDDIIIKSQDMAQHAEHLDQVLSSLKEHNLFCQLPKCTWAQKQLKYLGHIVTGKGVEPDPGKVKALASWEPPLTLIAQLATAEAAGAQKESTALRDQIATECRRFLGFMNYFHRFIPRYSDLACDLHKHTQKSPPVWTDDCTTAWNKLKFCLQNATMMYHPDFRLPFHVFSDASTKAIGGVLIQYRDGIAHPVAYVARKLTSAEVNYTTTEQEMLAYVYCFTQWRCYLEGSQVLLHSDHEPLTWLATQERPNRRQARWLEFLAGFRYEVLYVKGDRNVVADALSRMLTPPAAENLHMPGDSWPVCSQPQYVFSYCLGGASEGPPGSSSAVAAPEYAPGSASGPSPLGTAYGASRIAVSVPAVSGGMSTNQVARGQAALTYSADTEGGTGLASPYHRYILLGGYTRRNSGGESAVSAGQPAGGGSLAASATTPSAKRKQRTSDKEHRAEGMQSARLSSSKRVTFADEHEELAQRAHVAAPVSPTDPQSSDSAFRAGSQVQITDSRGQGHSAGVEATKATQHPVTPCSNSELPGTPPMPDQHGAAPSTSAQEIDPSLSAYELLAEQLFDRIRAGTRADDSVQTESQLQKFQLSVGKGDLLWRGNLLYVPSDKELRQDILYWHHDVPWCGHLGIQKSIELVQRQFWWPGMVTDIKNYVQTCYKCQSDKPDRRRKRPPLTFIEAPSSCWRTVGVDLIVDLTPSEPDKYNAIVVFCCHLSKMVRLIPTHTTLTTEGFVEIFFREIFPHYGMPTKIVSDRGPQWNSKFFRALCDRADIRLSLSTAYHPQTNGLVERTNEVVETALRHYVAPDQTDWNKKLPFVEFALNDMNRDASGVTPFRMNRITVPLSPFEAVKDRIATQSDIQYPKSELVTWMGVSMPKGERTFLQSQEEFSRARQSVHWAKCKMKEAHDKQGIVNHHYSTGELVWLSTKHISLRHPSLRHKFSPKFVGPVKVLECSSNGSTVLLELPSNLKIHPRVSVTLVKPYKARNDSEIQPVWIDGAQEWEVEAIINHNIVSTKSKRKQKYVEFLVQWKGSCEPSWHEFRDCENCVDTVEKYLGQCTKGTRAKMYRAMPASEKIWLSQVFQREALNT